MATATPPRSTTQARDRLRRAVAYYARQRGITTAEMYDMLTSTLIRLQAKKPGPKRAG